MVRIIQQVLRRVLRILIIAGTEEGGENNTHSGGQGGWYDRVPNPPPLATKILPHPLRPKAAVVDTPEAPSDVATLPLAKFSRFCQLN